MSATTVLIVEDEGIVAEDLACKIRQFGYEVIGTTGTGEEAVEIARQQQPDLVLMDIRLAGAMDGIEAAQQIHRENNLPILFLTAHSDTATSHRAQDANASGYILKPFDDRDLRIQIEMTLHKFQAEKKLRESEERYRLLAETMLQGVVHQDGTGKIIAMNPAAKKILGKSETEFQGGSSMELEHQTIRENGSLFPGEEHPSMVALQTGRQVRDVIMGVFNPERRQYRWLNIDAIPVFINDTKMPAEVYTIFEDITDWKRSQEMQARLAAIVTSADDAIIGMDLKNTVQTWNAGAEKLFGYRSDEMIGKNVDLLLAPGDENKIPEILPKMGNDREIQKFESFNRSKDGTIFPVAVTISLIRDASGVIIGSSKIAHDISGRKRSEAEREATIECLRLINESKDKQELLKTVTTFFQKLSSCEAVGIRLKKDNRYPYHTTIGFPENYLTAAQDQCLSSTVGAEDSRMANPMLDCLCGDFAAAEISPGKTFFTDEGSFWCNSTTELRTSMAAAEKEKTGGMCCINAGFESIALIPFGLGNNNLGYLQLNDRLKGKFSPQAIALLARLANHLALALAKFQADEALTALLADLEIKVKERTIELQEMQQLYLHTEKLAAIGKLSASISHEFNNPLQGIMSILNVVKKRAILEQEDKELVAIALDEGKRIKNLIRSLQDFNRPSSGVPAPMDVHHSLNSVLLLHKYDFDKNQIVVETDYAEKLPHITAVSDQIKQVFLNLLTNAADACQNRGGVITVSTRQEDGMVAVTIKDNGVGIQPEDIDQLFRPFYTTKPEVKGIGLGLPVSYGIVKKHRGEIRVKSTPGKSSTFTVLLPIKSKQPQLAERD